MIDGLIIGFIVGLVFAAIICYGPIKEILDWQSNRIDFWFKSSMEWRDRFFELKFRKEKKRYGG